MTNNLRPWPSTQAHLEYPQSCSGLHSCCSFFGELGPCQSKCQKRKCLLFPMVLGGLSGYPFRMMGSQSNLNIAVGLVNSYFPREQGRCFSGSGWQFRRSQLGRYCCTLFWIIHHPLLKGLVPPKHIAGRGIYGIPHR